MSVSFQHHILTVEMDHGAYKCNEAYEANY